MAPEVVNVELIETTFSKISEKKIIALPEGVRKLDTDCLRNSNIEVILLP